jgi:hypothetical protein
MAFDWGSRLTQLDNAVTQAREQEDQSLAARKTQENNRFSTTATTTNHVAASE